MIRVFCREPNSGHDCGTAREIVLDFSFRDDRTGAGRTPEKLIIMRTMAPLKLTTVHGEINLPGEQYSASVRFDTNS